MWHQRLTLVVNTPSGEVSGSAVIKVSTRFFDPPQVFGSAEVVYHFTGEAVVIEVLPGKYLFALLGDPSELFYAAARDRFAGLSRREWLSEIPKQTEPVELTGDLIPMLVTFDDVTKPETVREVDPADLEATFGPGYVLGPVTLAITGEPVTEGPVEAALVWLNNIWPDGLDGSRFRTAHADSPLANSLGANSFSTEIGE